ncbi:hypothetical protein F5Y14DRAFT_108248 [Nemania sp. NC0429]|nr:hypothetical protein F5Y14DRAFT_108248 [Nemania sp. NC0429]
MAETATPPVATPKRKRDDLLAEMRLSASPAPRHDAKTIFSFQPLNLRPIIRSNDLTEDGNSSPQSKVARKFEDLAIREGSGEGLEGNATGNRPEGGGGGASAADARTLCWIGNPLAAPDIPRFDFDAGTDASRAEMQLDVDDDEGAVTRKRAKTFEVNRSGPSPTTDDPAREISNLTAHTFPVGGQINDRLSPLTDPRAMAASAPCGSSNSQKSVLSTRRQTGSNGRRRRRAGTPPLSSKGKGDAQSLSTKGEEEGEELVIVDPVRAALTWREDEITVYDPEDKDDDGTGINGIGFKPTAAVAYQRAQKRRQQLAEYRKREESEARTRRSQRRRGHLGGGAEMARKHSLARVHFSDTPPTTIMTT